jgi:L-threonylcarbamoyladenylate synthase
MPGVARLLAAADPTALDAASDVLRRGGIVGIPTETVYGLAVMPTPEALERLIAAKERAHDKGIALLIDGLDQAEALAAVPAEARALADWFWPGPLTLVLHCRPGSRLPDAVTGGRSTVGLRLPDHLVPRRLARWLGPIAVSSANISGQPEARTAQELLDRMGARLPLVLDDGPVRGGVPSSVVEVEPAGAWRLLRQGALSEQQLREVIAASPARADDARVH